jgi:hypothetical protein
MSHLPSPSWLSTVNDGKTAAKAQSLPVETKAQKDRNVIPFSGTYIHLVGGQGF